MKNMNLENLLVMKLNSLYDIENNLVEALPGMAEASTDPDLKQAFLDHLEETRNHLTRLEEALEMLGEKPEKIKVAGIRGIVDDAKWIIKNIEGEAALDSNLIRAAQYAEHYEMAGYRGAIAWAEMLGKDDVASLLQETLDEEMEADSKLEDLGSELDKNIS
jgi:ferritin-like metal-binding protein YciE